MSIFEKTLLIQRLIYALQGKRSNKPVNDEEVWILRNTEQENHKHLDDVIENLENALLAMGLTVHKIQER